MKKARSVARIRRLSASTERPLKDTHGVGGFHGADKAQRLNHSECIHGVRTYQNPCTKAIDGSESVYI